MQPLFADIVDATNAQLIQLAGVESLTRVPAQAEQGRAASISTQPDADRIWGTFHIPISRLPVETSVKMSNSPHPGGLLETPNDFKEELTDKDKCHLYLFHQNGKRYCLPNESFRNVAEGVGGDKCCGNDRQLKDCVFPKDESVVSVNDTMPSFFVEKLKNICEHCECKSDILWRNLHRPEQHSDACFRYFEKQGSADRCFLKLYALRVPFIAEQKMAFSMVHHIRAEGNEFVATQHDREDNGEHGNKEHMFAFVEGLTTHEIGQLADLIHRWQDVVEDHSERSAGITSRLFIAAILSQYGSTVSGKIRETVKALKDCDQRLEDSRLMSHDHYDDMTTSISLINHELISTTRNLTGIRSTMHYLAESANILVNENTGVTTFEEYVEARFKDWGEHCSEERLRSLTQAFQKLDSCKEKIRDHDKLAMVKKKMWQHKTDVKSLQQHIDIDVGMARNLIAERDRSIQIKIFKNTARDSFNMRIITILTALFLPGTFMAIFLTTPMFNWVDSTEPVVVELPTKIYWGFTCALTFLFIIGIAFMTNPMEFYKAILEKSWVYNKYRKPAKGDEESNGQTNGQTNGQMNEQK